MVRYLTASPDWQRPLQPDYLGGEVRRSLARLMAACVLVLASLAVYVVVRNVRTSSPDGDVSVPSFQHTELLEHSFAVDRAA